MRWPWEIFMKSKSKQHKEKKELVDAAQDAVQQSYTRINRLDRILAEARDAERIAMHTPRR